MEEREKKEMRGREERRKKENCTVYMEGREKKERRGREERRKKENCTVYMPNKHKSDLKRLNLVFISLKINVYINTIFKLLKPDFI